MIRQGHHGALGGDGGRAKSSRSGRGRAQKGRVALTSAAGAERRVIGAVQDRFDRYTEQWEAGWWVPRKNPGSRT